MGVSSLAENDLSDADIKGLVNDLEFVIRREFLYNETMRFRAFLMLFYLEISNVNDVDPFSVLTSF